MSHEKGMEAAVKAAISADIIEIDGMEGVRINDFLHFTAEDAEELGVKLGIGDDGKAKWHSHSDIRSDEFDDCNRAILRPVIKAAIKAYLDASGMVMVPREATDEMVDVGQPRYDDLVSSYEIWREMISAAPNPFLTPEESRESSGRS